MPNYAEPFEAAGRVTGLGAGTGLGSLLGQIGSVLDSPRQALWNLARSGYNAATGQGTWDDALRALPGAAGAVGGGLLAATGVGLPAAIGIGSLIGGAGQTAGNAVNEEKFRAPTAEDVTGEDNPLLNFLVSAAGDPLTYAGGLGGAAKGAKAGRSLGAGLEEAALRRGPNYGGGTSALEEALSGPKFQRLMEHGSEDARDYLEANLDAIRSNPSAMGELSPGSQYLGHGSQTVAFRSPNGGVVTFRTPEMGTMASEQVPGSIAGLEPRVNIPEMLQASRSRLYGGDYPLLVEHAPELQRAIESRTSQGMSPLLARGEVFADELNPLHEGLESQGVNFWDKSLANVGRTPSGSLMVLDPNALEHSNALTGELLPHAGQITGDNPGRVTSALLRILGSDKSIRSELARAASQYHGGQSVLPSVLAGA